MKMKWKQVLYSLIVGAGMTISMTACSDNDNPGVDTQNPDDLLEDAYFSFQSSLESAVGSRALDTDDGTTDETKVNRIRIVLYDAATNIANYAYDYSGTALHKSGQDFQGSSMLQPTADEAPAGYNPTFKKFMPQAMEVKKKPYKLLVLVNPSDELVGLTRASKEFVNIKPSEKGVTNTTNVSNCTVFREQTGSGVGNDLTAFIGKANHKDNPDNFLMANFQEYVNVPESALQTSEEKAYLSPVTVKVDRAVAKVSMKGDYTAISAASNAKVENGTWRLDVTNKKSFWMRHMTKALKGVDEVIGTIRDNIYAEDPNFDLYSWERTPAPSGLITTSKDDIKNYFNYITKTDVDITLNNAWSYEYALENTMKAEEQYEDVTTAAVLKITYLPNKTALGTTLSSPGYFVWGTYVFTADELVDIKNYDPASSDPKYDTFLTLRQYLIDNAPVLEAATGFGTGFSAPGNASKEVLDITYNHDAINYYRILIRHFNDDQEKDKMAYGRYGIVRNTWYRLTLNSIAGPGSIDVPEPKGPDDKELVLGVSIEVLPWLIREQPVDID